MPHTTALCRRSFVALCVASLLFTLSETGCRGKKAYAGEKESAKEGTIVAFGNSLTRGYGVPEKDAYPAQLERKLRSQGYPFRVVNAGINGETSSGALSRAKWILSLEPDIVILETGANDGFRGIKPEVVEKNIDEMARIFKEHRATVVLAGMQMLSNLGAEYTGAFKRIYPAVAEKQGVILIPFFLAGVAGEPALNLSDGVHPTAAGYRIVTETVFPYVVEAIKKREGLPE